jgi:hypothetical protein
MSIEKAAEFARMHGRGNDSMLVHMSPKEVNALQAMAKQHGGSLTINPQTGLPEAGFLDAILPAVAGAGLSLIPGVGPLMAAGIVGAGTGLLTKDLNKGLMAGLGAFGGASLAGGLMNAGAGAGLSSVEAAAAANPTANIAELTQAAQSNIDPSLLEGMSAEQVAQANVLPQNASNFDKLLKGTSNTTFNADFFKKNLMPLGAIAAPLLMGGGQGNLFGGNQQAPSTAPGYIRPHTYQQVRNPGYTGAGTPYFTQTMTPGTPVAASDFGATTMADGGITSLPAANPAPGVVVYDPVSGRYIQQAANTVPMAPIAAPVTEPVGGLSPVQYNPATGQYVTPPPAAAPIAAVAPPPNNYYYGNDGGVDGSSNSDNDGTTSGNESGGAEGADGSDGGANGSGEGWNSGGLMHYAMGGEIGGRYASPDDMTIGDRVGAHQTVNMAPHYPMQGLYQGYDEGGKVSKRDDNSAPTVRELLEIIGNDRDKYERLAKGEEFNPKDYSANEIQAVKLLHTANKTEDPERYLESLSPFHDNQLNYALKNTNFKGFVTRKEPNTTVMRRMDPATLPHELTHSLQYHNEDRGNKLSTELYPYIRGLDSEAQDKTFGKAPNRFDNPSEVYANLNARAFLQNAAGGDFVNSPEGRALLPDRKSQGQYYANTMPGIQSIYGYREDSKIPEDRFKRDSRDSYATQLAKYVKHKTKDYADGGITNAKMAAVQQYAALAASSPDGMKQVMAKAKAGDYNAMTALNNLQGTPNQNYAGGGISHLGGYSDGGRLLKGPGDGVSDDIPAQIGARQPARLADGEFVVPARIVSELGNGSTEAGAKRLYAMMDRVQSGRKKSVGKGKVAVDSKAYKHLPA